MKRNTLTGAGPVRIAVVKTLIVLFLLVEIYPMIWMVLSSLRSPSEFTNSPIYALPKGFYYQNYLKAWTVGKMNIYYRNSIIATFSSLFFIIVLSATAAFAITKMKWKLSNATLLAFLAGIMINRMRLKTVQTGLLYFTTEWDSREWGPTFAALLLRMD